MTIKIENLGPADRILQTLLTYSDHLHHGRNGVVTPDPSNIVGVKWEAATHKVEGGKTIVYLAQKKKRTRVGELNLATKQITEGGRNVGSYRKSGLFPEVAAWVYEQIAKVWEHDNEFAARWASYAFDQTQRDLKMALAAFMLCQSRAGLPIIENGEVLFNDEDYRDVGEAMMLIVRKESKGLDPKYLLRMHDFLKLPQIAAINRRLGFGKSTQRPFLGRWARVVEKWLAYREENPKILEGLIDNGFRTTVMELACRVGYKPMYPSFFTLLRWKQQQTDKGHREFLIGEAVTPAESWEGLSETKVCEAIIREKPSWKRVIGLLGATPPTRAMLAAAIDANVLSDKDLVIMTPTLEALGLLEIQVYRERHERALRSVEDLRMINIAKNVRSEGLKEKMQAAGDAVLQKAMGEASRNLRAYVLIDVSGSMDSSIEEAKTFLAQFLQGFPPDQVHVVTFNSFGRVITIKRDREGKASARSVTEAFKGIKADGGTSHAAGVRALRDLKPKDDEDSLFIFIGDEGEHGTFDAEVKASGLRPSAFGLIKVGHGYNIITETAKKLDIPCFPITKETFKDPYAIVRTIANLIASTPIGKPVAGKPVVVRETLAEQIAKHPILAKPSWAA